MIAGVFGRPSNKIMSNVLLTHQAHAESLFHSENILEITKVIPAHNSSMYPFFTHLQMRKGGCVNYDVTPHIFLILSLTFTSK